MSELRKQYLFDIIGAVLAGALLTEALLNLVPAGMWLYLIYHVMGTVIITNKLNRIIRG